MALPVTVFDHRTGATTILTPKPINLNVGRVRIPLDFETEQWLRDLADRQNNARLTND